MKKTHQDSPSARSHFEGGGATAPGDVSSSPSPCPLTPDPSSSSSSPAPYPLLQHFHRAADHPEAIPKLRRFILDLAVRGKLVPQDPNDEPASELLKQIEKEKARQIKSSTIRSPRNVEVDDQQQELFPIPSAWSWCWLQDVGIIVGGGTPPSGDKDNFIMGGTGTAWLTPADMGKNHNLYISHGERDLTPKGLASSSATLMPKGSVLFTSRAPIGYVAIAANEVTTNQGFKSVLPYEMKCSRYIAIYFKAFARWIDSKAPGTTFKEVSGKIVAALPFPLPPLAEQHRIVAKVDELMALCDALEAAQEKRESRRDLLVAAALHALTDTDSSSPCPLTPDPYPLSSSPDPYPLSSSPDPYPLSSSPDPCPLTPLPYAPPSIRNSKFVIHNFPALTARPHHNHLLRQTILNLAVRGKLVPQDPNDEPASELLKRIEKEKARLVKEGKRKRSILPEENAGNPQNFPIPENWEWVLLGELCTLVTSGSRDWAKYYANEGAIFVRMGNLSRDSYRLRLHHIQRVNPPSDSEGQRTKLEEGDILVSITGDVGMLGLIPPDFGEAYINQHTCLIRPTELIKNRYLPTFFASPYAQEQFNEPQRGIKNSFRLTDMTGLYVPLPPLAEQHRIVAKVDELMFLCDALESQITTTASTQHKFLEATLQKALANG